MIQEYFKASEWQLATLEQCYERKSTSKSDKQRQREIVFRMLKVCQEHCGVLSPRDLLSRFSDWPRVDKLLDGAKQEPEGLSGALDRFIMDVTP